MKRHRGDDGSQKGGSASSPPAVKSEALGEIAVALLPLQKLKLPSPRGKPFEREIHEFLMANFNGYTVSSGSISGHWKDDRGRDHYGEHRQYKVAIPAPESRNILEIFLADLAGEMHEECIYLEVGRQILLVYRTEPPRSAPKAPSQ